eukprot:UN01192
MIFNDYYLPHLDEQLYHLQQQMELSFISHTNNITTSNNNSTTDGKVPIVIDNNNNNTNNDNNLLLPLTFSYQLNRINNDYISSRLTSPSSSFYYQRRLHVADYVVSYALQNLIHQQQLQQQQDIHNQVPTSSTMSDDRNITDNHILNHNNSNNNNNNIMNQYQ